MKKFPEQRMHFSTGQKVALSAFAIEFMIAPTIAVNMKNVNMSTPRVDSGNTPTDIAEIDDCGTAIRQKEFQTPSSKWALSSAAGKIVARCTEKSPVH
jgi:hypothetical protein